MDSTKSIMVVARWGPQAESTSILGKKLALTLSARACKPGSSHWYDIADQDCVDPLRTDDLKSMLAYIESGRERDADLGYRCAGWNGMQDSEQVIFSASLGVTSFVGNSIGLEVDGRSSVATQMDEMLDVVRDLIRIWSPRYCEVTRYERPREPRGYAWAPKDYRVYPEMYCYPDLNWALYLSDRHYTRAQVPSAAAVEKMDHGTLVVVSPSAGDVNDEADWARINRVRTELGLEMPFVLERFY